MVAMVALNVGDFLSTSEALKYPGLAEGNPIMKPFVKNPYAFAAVKPGKSTESPLLLLAADAVKDMEMPPTDKRDKFPALTREQLALVRAWIDQGAK